MELKQYQVDTLAALRRFFEEARVVGPANAYEAVTAEPEQAARLGGYAGAYTSLNEMPEVLRLPSPAHRRRQDPAGRPRRDRCPQHLDREGLSLGAVAGAEQHHSAADSGGTNKPSPRLSAGVGRRLRRAGAGVRHCRLHSRPPIRPA